MVQSTLKCVAQRIVGIVRKHHESSVVCHHPVPSVSEMPAQCRLPRNHESVFAEFQNQPHLGNHRKLIPHKTVALNAAAEKDSSSIALLIDGDACESTSWVPPSPRAFDRVPEEIGSTGSKVGGCEESRSVWSSFHARRGQQ